MLARIALLFILVPASVFAGWKFPHSGQTHFATAWQHHKHCGLPTGPEIQESNGWWYQRFDHCLMTEAPVAILHDWTPTPVLPTPVPTVPPPPAPTPVPTPQPASDDAHYVLNLLNEERASHGIPPLSLNSAESVCALAHSAHMEQEGYISHDQFPADICVPYSTAGENVGSATGYGHLPGIDVIQQIMVAEPYSPAYCLTNDNHHCNEDNPAFTQVGIGITDDGSVWLTEDFTG